MSEEKKQDNQNVEIEDLLEDAREQDGQDSADIPEPDGDDSVSLEEQIADLKSQLTRSQADYHNLVRRMRTEQESLGHFTRGKTVTKFLPIIDDLERALDHLPDDIRDHAWVEGVVGMQKNFLKILADMDVEVFDSLGESIDPDKHDVVSQGPGKQDEIIAQIEKGYTHGGEVLRHAKVVVGHGEE